MNYFTVTVSQNTKKKNAQNLLIDIDNQEYYTALETIDNVHPDYTDEQKQDQALRDVIETTKPELSSENYAITLPLFF